MRTLLVFGEKTFKIEIPKEAKITFGPWSPPSATAKSVSYDRSERALSGTLRIYETTKAGANLLAVFSGVNGYRDTSMGYAEQVAKEEGATIWKSDEHGYEREEKVTAKHEWVDDQKLLGEGKPARRRGKKRGEA